MLDAQREPQTPLARELLEDEHGTELRESRDRDGLARQSASSRSL